MKKAVPYVLLWGTIFSGLVFADDKKIAKDLKGPHVSGAINVVVQRKSWLLGGALKVVGRKLKDPPPDWGDTRASGCVWFGGVVRRPQCYLCQPRPLRGA